MTGSLSIAARAAYILRDNSTGLITKAAPALYPHQWSWDAAFNAIGLASVDLPRARLELSDGRVVLEASQGPAKALGHPIRPWLDEDLTYRPGSARR